MVDGLASASGFELLVGVGGDVVVGEFFEAYRAEDGDEFAVYVGAVAGVGGGLEQELHALEPPGEVGGHRLVRIGVEPQLAPFEEAPQRALRRPRVLEPSPAHGAPPSTE
ncbi:hypothetical protein OG977_09920 [Kitasatospora purpeofusca]